MHKRRLAGGQKLFHEFGELCEICEFDEISKFHKICKICKFCDCCSRTGCTVSHRAWEKLYCVSLVLHIHLFIVIIILIIIIIIIPSCLVLLNCFYLCPQVLLFVHSPSHPAAGWVGERVSSCAVVVAGCQVKPQHQIIHIFHDSDPVACWVATQMSPQGVCYRHGLVT